MRSILIPALILSCTSLSLSAQSFSNGSLEGDTGEGIAPAGWTTAEFGVETVAAGGLDSTNNPGGTYAQDIPASPNGGTFVLAHFDTSSGESFSQTVSSLVPGEIYQVSFYQANGGWSQGTSSSPPNTATGFWEVALGSATAQSPAVEFLGFGNQTWSQVTFDLMAQNTSELLTFTASYSTGQDFQGRMAIDGISVFNVPEPGVISLLGLGMLALVTVQFRRRNR